MSKTPSVKGLKTSVGDRVAGLPKPVKIGLWVGPSGVPPRYDAPDPATRFNRTTQCADIRFTGAGPNWYEFIGCNPPLTPATQSNLS